MKASVLQSCGRSSSSYELVRRILSPLDEYFGGEYFSETFQYIDVKS